MKLWTTEIQAIDPVDGKMKPWHGPHIPGEDYQDALLYCKKNELGYCKVTGELISETSYSGNIQNN